MMDIERMAAKRLEDKGPAGKLDGGDVKALLAGAYHDGKVDKTEAKQLNFVRNHYKDQMDSSARSIFDEFSVAWMQDTRDQIQESEREHAETIKQDNADFNRILSEGDKIHEQNLEVHVEKVSEHRESKARQLEASPLEINQKEAATLGVFFGLKKS